MFVVFRVFYLEWLPDDVELSNNVNTFNSFMTEAVIMWKPFAPQINGPVFKLQPLSPHFNHGTIIRTGI